MDRALRVLALSAAALVLSTGAATAQQPDEAKRLGVLVGEWTYDQMAGDAQCAWLGQLIVHCKSTWTTAAGAEQAQVFLLRWDPAANVYNSYRFYASGSADAGYGWFAADAWTLVFEGQLGTRTKAVATIDSTSWKYTWYRSRAGGDWEKTSEGSMTRVAGGHH